MLRRYDIQDGRDIQRAAEIMEEKIAERRAISTISSTMRTEGPIDRTKGEPATN
jgi:hypothetical protein